MRKTKLKGIFVTAEGDVFSTRRGGLKQLKGGHNGTYLRVDTTYIHELVAEAFLGKRPKGYHIDHLNGNCLDNRAENLEYVKPQINWKRGRSCKEKDLPLGLSYLSTRDTYRFKSKGVQLWQEKDREKAINKAKEWNKNI